jgi:hypothetical protein
MLPQPRVFGRFSGLEQSDAPDVGCLSRTGSELSALFELWLRVSGRKHPNAGLLRLQRARPRILWLRELLA